MIWYEPGRDAADRLPEWVIRQVPNLGVPEVMCTRRKVILLDRDDDPVERRCSLAHAVAHIDLRHESSSGLISRRQEDSADKLAARRLVPLPRLTRAWIGAESFAEVASGLEVTPRLLIVRIECLRRSERDQVGEILAERYESA